MKKLFAVLTISAFAACGNGNDTQTTDTTSSSAADTIGRNGTDNSGSMSADSVKMSSDTSKMGSDTGTTSSPR